MKFNVFHDSRIGRRSMNQDRLDWAHTAESLLLVVCDGMGGHRHGEVAAQLAVQQLMTAFRNAATPRLDDPPRFLNESLRDAHFAINNYAALRAIPVDDAPRTTCVACIIQDGHALWAHVGDSRLYLVRAGQTFKRTFDHSRVQMLIDAGEITLEEAKTHPQRNLVFSCLGGDMTPRIDISPAVALEAGDTLALCSDGAWAPLADRLSKGFGLPLERAVPFLLDEAEATAGPGCDNLSLIALRWESSAGRPQIDDATRPFSAISTIVQNFAAEIRNTMLSDAEIDRAVTEIRSTIHPA
jgi:serine/threonine protein phosphatase PrpC